MEFPKEQDMAMCSNLVKDVTYETACNFGRRGWGSLGATFNVTMLPKITGTWSV